MLAASQSNLRVVGGNRCRVGRRRFLAVALQQPKDEAAGLMQGG